MDYLASLFRSAAIPLLLMLCTAVAAQDGLTSAASSAQDTPILKAQWQTFESCPRAERPCGAACMPESFSCCDKATATVCPPGKSCCGSLCGCGRCRKCEGGVCVPDDKCPDNEREQSSAQPSSASAQASSASPATATGTGTALSGLAPLIGIGAAVGIGVIGSNGDPVRAPISP